MIINSKMKNFFESKDNIVNWINTKGKCFEPGEISFRNYYPKNYIDYINHPDKLQQFNRFSSAALGSVLINFDNDIPINGKGILNVYLYDFPKEPLTVKRIEMAIDNIIECLTVQALTDISIPIPNSYSELTEQDIENIILNRFYSHASHINVTLYT